MRTPPVAARTWRTSPRTTRHPPRPAEASGPRGPCAGRGRYEGAAVRERLPWRDPASKRVRFIVPATSSAASHGHQAPQPGGDHSGMPAVSGGGHTTGATTAATGLSPAAQSAEITGITPVTGTARVKRGMADMLKGGVIMDVVTPEQAKVAEDAGAVAVMALERVPADIRAQGGVARMS